MKILNERSPQRSFGVARNKDRKQKRSYSRYTVLTQQPVKAPCLRPARPPVRVGRGHPWTCVRDVCVSPLPCASDGPLRGAVTVSHACDVYGTCVFRRPPSASITIGIDRGGVASCVSQLCIARDYYSAPLRLFSKTRAWLRRVAADRECDTLHFQSRLQNSSAVRHGDDRVGHRHHRWPTSAPEATRNAHGPPICSVPPQPPQHPRSQIARY